MPIRPDIEDLVIFQIDKTNKIAKTFAQRVFDELGLGVTIDQWLLLKIIDEQMAMSQRELARASYRDPASITRTLDLLENKELIIRKPVPSDRRQYQIMLSKKGKEFVRAHMPMIRRLRSKSVEGFSVKDMQALRTLLSRMQENLS